MSVNEANRVLGVMGRADRIRLLILFRLRYRDVGCWLWTGQRNSSGPMFRLAPLSVQTSARRAGFALVTGAVPPSIWSVDPCALSGRPCVRPDHQRPRQHAGLVLTEYQAKQVIEWAHARVHYREIAEHFRVSVGAVYDVIRGTTFRHLSRETTAAHKPKADPQVFRSAAGAAALAMELRHLRAENAVLRKKVGA